MKRVVRIGCAGVVVAGLACNGPGCTGTASDAELRFFVRPSTNPFLTKTTVVPVGWSIVDLQPEPNLSLTESSVDFVAPNATTTWFDAYLGPKQIEAHLFMVNLDQRNTALRGAWAGAPVSFWDDIAGEPASGRDVYLPYPPTTSWPVPTRLPYVPKVADFWPNSSPSKPASLPSGSGSVKTAWVVYPGACSYEYSLTTLLEQISDQMFDTFAGVADSVDGLAQRNYARGTAMLEPAPLPVGGFGLYFDYAGTGSGLFNFEATANVEYSFGTREGILSLEDPTIHDWLFYPLIHPGCPLFLGMQCGQYFVDLLRNKLPSVFLEQTTRAQRAPSPIPIPFFTTCTSGQDPTLSARTAAAGVAEDGALTLGMSPAAAAAVRATVQDAYNWVCVDLQGHVVPNGGTANFVLRARRVQVYPDAVELVWFDEQDPGATGFAYYAMLAQLRAADPTSPLFPRAMSTLCSRQRRFFGVGTPPVGSMPIATVTRGPASCATPPCPRN